MYFEKQIEDGGKTFEKKHTQGQEVFNRYKWTHVHLEEGEVGQPFKDKFLGDPLIFKETK